MRIRTGNNRRRSRDRRAFLRYWNSLVDNCQVCHGTKGGTRGNENRIRGIVCCDYCHADESVYDMARERDAATQTT